MKQITEDYVSYEIAVLLKEKGFKQDCDYATSWYAAEYYKNSAQGEWFEGEHQIIEDIDDKCTISYLSDKGVFIPAPTHQMTLKWLREVHNIVIVIEPYDSWEDARFEFTIYKRHDNDTFVWDMIDVLNSLHEGYETCIDAAVKYTLENLI